MLGRTPSVAKSSLEISAPVTASGSGTPVTTIAPIPYGRTRSNTWSLAVHACSADVETTVVDAFSFGNTLQILARRDASLKGSGCQTIASTTLKIVVPPAMPSASVKMATPLDDGFRFRKRAANRMSWATDSRSGRPWRSRQLSLTTSRLPICNSASRRAASGDMPARRLSSTCIWRWSSISSASSRSRRGRPKRPPQRTSHVRSVRIKVTPIAALPWARWTLPGVQARTRLPRRPRRRERPPPG
jgi:hypothetical protein